ncbi:hypothetical protein KKG22_00370 [Patescibacteria group bacterium]|nr:hypothetical protein [Patescibacteria group bacterium]MBU1722130.1 hypothetical protein [Patescibacteria group bacterium]MBU1901179.1 hypothetical protein [Patescibacteria group bacterium]
MKHGVEQLLAQMKDQDVMSPDTSWVAKNRAQLLTQISNTVDVRMSRSFKERLSGLFDIFVPTKIFVFARSFAVVFLVIALAGSGWLASVSASSDSLPGDTLYKVKLATEKTKVIVAGATGNTQAVTKYHLEAVEKRSKEIIQVKKEPQKVEVAAAELKKSIESTKETLKKAKEDGDPEARNIAKDITKKTKEISQSLKEVTDEEETGIEKEMMAIKKEVNQAGLEAVILLTEESSDTTEDAEEVKQLVQEQVEEILIGAEEMKLVVVDMVGVASSTKKIEDAVALSTSKEEAEEQIGEGEYTPGEETLEDRVKKADTSVQEVDKLALELRELLVGDDVGEMVKKAQEFQDAASDAEEVLAEVSKDVDTQAEVAKETDLVKEVEAEKEVMIEEEKSEEVVEEKGQE